MCLLSSHVAFRLGRFAVVSSRANYGRSCTDVPACSVSPVLFLGPLCTFGVVACIGCLSNYTGGTVMTLIGVGLGAISGITIGGAPVTYTDLNYVQAYADTNVANALRSLRSYQPTFQSVTALQVMHLTAPALVIAANLSDLAAVVVNPAPAYQTLNLTVSLPQTVGLTTVTYARLIYFTSPLCTAVGLWKPDGGT
jgi:hypothetical protein